MAAFSATHCRSYSYSHSSSINGGQNQRFSFSSFSRLSVPAKAIRNSHQTVVLMQDGVVATKVTPVEKETPKEKLKDELLSVTSTKEWDEKAGFDSNENESTVSITVVGASGDLAKKKIFPALFALYYEDCLPKHFTIYGYARSKMTDAELRNMGGRVSNRLFYLSIPPNIFVEAVKCASSSASSGNGWTRVIVEKPFGRDSESSAVLTKSLKQYLTEDQIFRIDHYLGKELVENLSVLRFANLIFEPLWTRQYIRNVQIIFSEDFGTEGRGG
ncbi:hypothetical protein Gorai_017091 [Gossypium raimondii]|uniref:glucose-6-phosphate dehydrogenase (NADP(+)) n=1 Tax=Gossypium raimondii TaxID=29730 RepID=A0A7J8PAY0_GOSRA|nr:hypothetical protein [Gossypium raimondii]